MQRARSVALLLDYLGGDYQLGILSGVEDGARECRLHHLTVIGRSIRATQPMEAQNDIYRRLGAASVDGIIVGSGCIGNRVGLSEMAEFCRQFEGLALCSLSAALPGIPSITVSNRRGMYAVVDHAIRAHGCRRVAYIGGPPGGGEARQRLQGYMEALDAGGLAFDPALVETGDFWIQSGGEAAGRLLDQGGAIDAVIAANDYMALGALGTLRDRGVRVPGDIVVAGFDDVPSARIAAPSLTTVRQPLHRMGQLAVETVRRQLAGEGVPELVELDLELVTRQSCGCGYVAMDSEGLGAAPEAGQDARAWLFAQRGGLRDLLVRSIPFAPTSLGRWADDLLDALGRELAGERDQFLRELEEVLDRAQPRGEVIAHFNAVVAVLRASFRRAIAGGLEGGALGQRLEDLWYAATLLVAAAGSRSQTRINFETERSQDVLRASVEKLSTALGHAALIAALREVLPPTGIRSVAISLYDDPSTRSTLVPYFVWYAEGAARETRPDAFLSADLAPEGFFAADARRSYIVMPLAFDVDHYGIAVFEGGEHPSLYRALRDQIAASLKGAALHRAFVQQTELRERAERRQLQAEALIARQIQTGILPRAMPVEGLDLAALMLPAVEVGGDYYDVLPTRDGCWIGIGDVTGHGLLSGLVMLMIQGFVAGMIAMDEEATPADLVITLNSILFRNIRERMGRDEQASLMLMRYRRDGRLSFAGFHEEIMILRAATGRCERIPTRGFWLAAVRDVTPHTSDSEVRLEDGDLLVLFTDGVVEAADAHRREFGPERLCAVVEAQASRPPSEICGAILAAVQEWTPSQNDDVTVLVGRYRAPTPKA
jgi:DNA-binding LacI/PurR family transcriptional regulator/serine phosphatase RsbU (regulator of sigma subunit)